MQPRVLEGDLQDAPTRDGGGLEHRAFGEFVGPRGELASYALGWSADADPHVARLSVGIGAGNAYGGTFHLVMERDRRARWMRHWLLGTRAIATLPVLDYQESTLLVVRDDDDDFWQLIGATDAGDTDALRS
jgi:uncharacterized protein YfiM (DUF2279 family)